MPYIKRNDQNKIIAISATQTELCEEFTSHNNTEVLAFIAQLSDGEEKEIKEQFIEADLDFIRVMEDLIDTLISKNVICFTDLPVPVQEKIVRRRDIRNKLTTEESFLRDDSPLI